MIMVGRLTLVRSLILLDQQHPFRPGRSVAGKAGELFPASSVSRMRIDVVIRGPFVYIVLPNAIAMIILYYIIS